jgi:DNA-binding response OmpR family regulator
MPRKIVLIVEDEILSAMDIRDKLEGAGYQVLDLTSRRDEALAAAQARTPDLALVNIELHGRDDGISLAEDLTRLGIPVLFISGQVDRAQSAKSVAIGSMPKPYSATDMVRAVDHLIGRLAGDRSLAPPHRLEVFGPFEGDVDADAA